MNRNRLQELYDLLPDIDCTGDCWRHCGVAPTGDAERENISEAYSEDAIPTPGGDMMCNQLDRDTKRCTIHEERPLICRLFGLVKSKFMRCPHGCEPEFWVPDEVAHQLMDIIIDGDKDDFDNESIRQASSAFRQAIEETTKD